MIWTVVIIACCLTFLFWIVGLPFAESLLDAAAGNMVEQGLSIMGFMRVLYYALPVALSCIWVYWGYMASVEDQVITQPW